MVNQEVEVQSETPAIVLDYTVSKTSKKEAGGRPHFISELAKMGDPKDKILDILELAWIKNRSIGSIARAYNTSYDTIYRLIKDMNPSKEALIAYLELTPRRKMFYNPEANTSDYETVQVFINKAKRFELKNYVKQLYNSEKCWKFLKYKDPSRWSANEVLDFLATLKPASQSNHLDSIRQICPQIKDANSEQYIGTGRFREKIGIRKKDLFSNEVKMIVEALKEKHLEFERLIFEVHITVGAREGKDGKSGLTGLSWDRFKKDFSYVDLFESKVRGGIWSRDCPLTLFFSDLPERLRSLWHKRGKPTTDKLILKGYTELVQIYKQIRKALGEYYEGKVEPSLYQELVNLRPHDADKIHCNLLWESEMPLEIVAGQYLGKGEGIGLLGRIWLDINTIKKHYLSLTQRSERFKKLRDQVSKYSERFNGAKP